MCRRCDRDGDGVALAGRAFGSRRARQVRTNIACKVGAGLSLTDEGFHPTVLTLWRNKLRVSQPERIFDAVRAVVDETGVLKGKTRRALDQREQYRTSQ